MGILKISNELSLTNPALVKQCFQWLRDNYNAVIEGKTPARKEMIYYITGDGIPDGNFHLNVTEIVPGVITIKIEV